MNNNNTIKRAAGASDASNSRLNKKVKSQAQVREPLEGADNRPGRWVAEDWYLQLGDTVFTVYRLMTAMTEIPALLWLPAAAAAALTPITKQTGD
jgi:hypothetical protein